MVTLVKKPPPWIVSFHETKFTRLLERTRNFIEFSAWGRQDDFAGLPERDKTVWKEIALVLRGNKD